MLPPLVEGQGRGFLRTPTPLGMVSGWAFNPLLCLLIYINRFRGKRNYFLISPRGSGIAQILR